MENVGIFNSRLVTLDQEKSGNLDLHQSALCWLQGDRIRRFFAFLGDYFWVIAYFWAIC
jgi:hypothetical protein